MRCAASFISTMKSIALSILAVIPLALHGAGPVEIKLWPEGAPEKPGFIMDAEKEQPKKDANDVKRVTNVTEPTITIYKPEKANGTAVVVCPGGGYNILAIEHEGSQVCEYLNTLGVTAVLLKYRVPRRDNQNPSAAPLQDAQRAIGIVRKRASEFGIKPDRIGILGFSAGGNLCVMAALHPDERTYTQDPALDGDAAPDFAIPVYPAYIVEEKDQFKLRPEMVVTPKSPPMCLIHAHDDKLTAGASALLYLEYKKLGLPAELHIYAKGGHGFGMRKSGGPVNDWHVRCGEWMRSMGYLE